MAPNATNATITATIEMTNVDQFHLMFISGSNLFAPYHRQSLTRGMLRNSTQFRALIPPLGYDFL
jgi:hypothetical protein